MGFVFFYSGERVANYLVRNEYEIKRLLQKKEDKEKKESEKVS